MSSRKPFSLRNTLAFRLTLWYAGIFTVSSCIAFLLFYTLITSVIRDRNDEELLNQANRFATLYSTEGVDEVAKTAVLEAQAAGVRKVFFRLLSPSGEMFSSSNMSYWHNIAIRPEAIRGLLTGANHVFETIVIPNRKDEVRVLYVILESGNYHADWTDHGKLLPVLRSYPECDRFHRRDIPDPGFRVFFLLCPQRHPSADRSRGGGPEDSPPAP